MPRHDIGHAAPCRGVEIAALFQNIQYRLPHIARQLAREVERQLGAERDGVVPVGVKLRALHDFLERGKRNARARVRKKNGRAGNIFRFHNRVRHFLAYLGPARDGGDDPWLGVAGEDIQHIAVLQGDALAQNRLGDLALHVAGELGDDGGRGLGVIAQSGRKRAANFKHFILRQRRQRLHGIGVKLAVALGRQAWQEIDKSCRQREAHIDVLVGGQHRHLRRIVVDGKKVDIGGGCGGLVCSFWLFRAEYFFQKTQHLRRPCNRATAFRRGG